MSKPLAQIAWQNGAARLLVDGRPFLVLGLQWACESCYSLEQMGPLFPQAARLCANTAVLPVYWREVEPERGQFSFKRVDERIRLAEEHGLRAVFLWFATWKNAHASYAPDYVRRDPEDYPLAVTADGRRTVSLCPLSEQTWQRDRDALVALSQHLHQRDENRTVIMVQLQNEPGIIRSDRCYCATCTERFEAGQWEQQWGQNAAEAFSVASVAGYIDRLAADAKAVHPLPMYVNVWLSSAPRIGGVPGRHYPSGGAVPEMLDLFHEHSPHVDMLAPDIYSHGYRDFRRLCLTYGRPDNPLLIAEHGSAPDSRAEKNVFYAVGEHGALGFDPWAIDFAFPSWTLQPLVDPLGAEWGPQATALRDSYAVIGRAVHPIVEAQGTDRLFTFVQEPGEAGAAWAREDCDVLISYANSDKAG
ncbi:MAG: beta-galactosidase, partial [Planctomycetota bacterium]